MSETYDEHLVTVLGNINRLLGIDAVVTHRADEVKCWTHDDESGGRSKAYLSSFDCIQLSNAFMFLGARLAAPELHSDPVEP
jgi:hypothetical protein